MTQKIFGVYSSVSKKYCWFFRANNTLHVISKLKKKIGYDADKYRRIIKPIKQETIQKIEEQQQTTFTIYD